MYRMVDFAEEWMYTPPAQTTPMLSPIYPGDQGGSWSRSVVDGAPVPSSSGNSHMHEPGLGLDLGNLPMPHPMHAAAAPGSPRSTASSSSSSSGRSAPPLPKVTKKPFSLVKKWFSSSKHFFFGGGLRRVCVDDIFGGLAYLFNIVKGNFGKRRRISITDSDRGDEEDTAVPFPFVIPISTLHPPSTSLSSVEGREPEYDEFEWHQPLDLCEWKEWGYYARPWINGVFVDNYRTWFLPFVM